MDGPRYSTLIHSEHNNNITLTGILSPLLHSATSYLYFITGEGTIDGSGGVCTVIVARNAHFC